MPELESLSLGTILFIDQINVGFQEKGLKI